MGIFLCDRYRGAIGSTTSRRISSKLSGFGSHGSLDKTVKVGVLGPGEIVSPLALGVMNSEAASGVRGRCRGVGRAGEGKIFEQHWLGRD